MLPHVGDCRRVLIVGDGDGRFLAALLRAVPQAIVDSLDISPKMIDLAKRRIADMAGALDRVQFTVGDIRADPLPGTAYDLIVTNFLLDCFPADELEQVINRLSDVSTPNGKWIVGDFEMPKGFWSRTAARIALAGMYAFFRIVTRIPARKLVDPSPMLSLRGWQRTIELSCQSGVLVSRWWVRQSQS